MRFNANTFLDKVVGEDFLETLAKNELYKPNANVAIDLEDIRIGLKVVPRIILSLLIRELPPMKMGDVKAIPLFLGSGAILHVNKHDTDTYSGSIVDNGAVLVSFKYRPLPGVGLVIMSAFELYEMEEPKCSPPPTPFVPQAEVNVQKLIDERLALYDLVGQVVERKLMEKEAIQKLFLAKIKEQMDAAKELDKLKSDIANVRNIQNADPATKTDTYFRGMANGLEVAHAAAQKKEPEFVEAPKEMNEALSMSEKKPKKESPLKGFLDKKKVKKSEYEFKMTKGEIVECPDCLHKIFTDTGFSACICYGSDMDKKVFLKKTEQGIKLSFPKSWDKDNMLMLLEILRKKNG